MTTNKLLKIPILFLLFLGALFAKEDVILNKIVTLDTGYYDVEVKGCYAYVATNNGLKVLDLTDIKNIKPVSFVDSNATAAYDIAIEGDILYLANASSMKIIDISNPNDVREIGEFKNGAKSIIGVAVKEGYAYLSDFDNGFYVVDVKDPSNPVEIANVKTSGNAKKVAIEGDRAFVADGLDGVKVFDISNPSDPKIVGSYKSDMNVVDLVVDKNLLYIANESEGIEVLDVSDPLDIKRISFYFIENFGDSIYSVKKYANRLFVSNSISGLHILDVSDLNNIKEIANFQSAYSTFSAAVCKDNILIASNGGLSVAKFVKDSLEKISEYETGGNSWEVEVKDNYAYTISWKYGLKIIDISDITFPKIIGKYKSDFATDIVVDDKYAYISNDYAGVDIVDISDPKNPKLVSNIKTQGAWSVAKVKNALYVFDLYEGLIIVDVSNKKDPKVVDKISLGERYRRFYAHLVSPSYNMSDFKRDMKIKDGKLFVAAGDKGVEIFDIKKPLSPRFLANVKTSAEAVSLGLLNTYLYVAEKEEGVEVFDIEDPINYKVIDKIETLGKAMDIGFYDSLLLVADEHKGLSFFPISKIMENAKEESKDFVIGYDTLSIDVNEDKVFIADENAGLMIFQIIDSKKLEKIDRFINFLYLNILEREPDSEGFEFWKRELIKGQKAAKGVVKFFFESEEFKSKNLSDAEFIKILYKTIFQREPDIEGEKYWESKLAENMSREDIINAFIESPEFEKLLKSFGIN